MKVNGKLLALFFFTIALGVSPLWSSEATAQSSYFSARGCVDCHAAPVAASCNGCHYHGNAALRAATNKASYAPGETVTATLSGGSRSGWIKAILYDQSNTQLAASTGNASGMGGSATFPAALTAPAPTTPGSYTWKMAYYGNSNGTGHGEVAVNTNAFTVVATQAPADTTAPTVSSFTVPATASSLAVTGITLSASDNVGVTGFRLTETAAAPLASAAGWSAASPVSYSFATAGGKTLYAWARDAAGNVSLARSAAVTVTISTADTTKPTFTISALANGAFTNKATLNISGNAGDAGGLQSVTVNSEPVVVNQDGSFSAALTLAAGANTVTVIATDEAGNQQADVRTITFDPAAPILTVSAPADNSSSAQSFISLVGTVNETSMVTVMDNNGNPQYASISGNNFTATVNLVAGVNTIVVAAADLAGNTTSAKRTVTYDSSKMTLAVTNPVQDITTSKANLVLTGSIVDAASQVTVLITMDGRTFKPVVTNGTFTQTLAFTQAKQYPITITATDATGNSSSVNRNVIYNPAVGGDDDSSSHPFGWTNPRSSHQGYADDNGVAGCVSCHSIDQSSKGQPMSCYNCHGKEWDTPSTGGGTGGGSTASHPFGWTNPRSSHQDYADDNGVAGCVSCHSIDQSFTGTMSCYNCHGKEW